MRKALSPLNLPAQYDGCGPDFKLAHSQSCKNGGSIIARHDKIISKLISLSTMAFGATAVQAKPLIHPGSSPAPSQRLAHIETDDRGDILI